MTYTALKAVPEKIRNLEEFEGNSIRGDWVFWLEGGFRVYVVRSYATPILAISVNPVYQVIFNKSKYSSTTSRHQNLVQRALDGMDDLEFCSALEVYDLPRGDLEGFLSHLA